MAHAGLDGRQERFERATRTQHPHRDQDRHEIGHDADRDAEPFLGALDERFVERQPAPCAGHQERRHEPDQDGVREHA